MQVPRPCIYFSGNTGWLIHPFFLIKWLEFVQQYLPWTTEMIAVSLICCLHFFSCSLSSHPYLHLHLLLTVLFHSTQPTHPDINSHIFPSSRCRLTPLPDWLALLPLANDFARNIKGKSSISFRRSSLFKMYHLTLTFISTNAPCGTYSHTAIPSDRNGHLVHSTQTDQGHEPMIGLLEVCLTLEPDLSTVNQTVLPAGRAVAL